MKQKHNLPYLAFFLLFSIASPIAIPAQGPIVGGYSEASVTEKEVVAAAAFAIKEQQKEMQKDTEGESPKLELVTILEAHQQVVAGMNYRLKLKVTVNGEEKTAETVVWWQSWRKPNPYKLTSWTWK